ncbi:MAG: hypothetical protein HZB59_01915 [Ignavibacteriales bacterium]|nr:hypothetical protein [Ignavibacteriales bacterium]
MKKYAIILIVGIALLSSTESNAQRHRKSEPRDGGRPEQLEKYRKMRLIEFLNLNEEESVRFFAKHKIHEDKIREFMERRNKTIDDLADLIQKKEGNTEIAKGTEKVRTIDREIFEERQRFQEEVRQLITPIQFAKFIMFERDFGRKVRDAIKGLRPEPQHPEQQE